MGISTTLWAQQGVQPNATHPSKTALSKKSASDDSTEKSQTKFTAIRLQGLEKITARRKQFDAIMGAVTRFGNLEIIPHACWKSPDTQAMPETAGLLEVWHWKPGDKPALLFFGWMFSSSPALSSLKSAQYDVTVLECLKPENDSDVEKSTKISVKSKSSALPEASSSSPTP